MSVQATTWVWEQRRWSGNTLLIMLAIADAANREGNGSCQSNTTLSAMTGASRATVYRILGRLEAEGWIIRAGKSSKYGTVMWELPIGVGPVEALEDDRFEGSQVETEGGSHSETLSHGETEGVSQVRPNPKELTPLPVAETQVGETPTRATGARVVIDPETHPSRAITAQWQPRQHFARYLMHLYPGIDHAECTRRFVAHHISRQDTSRSWEAGLNLWMSQDYERWREQQGTDDLGVPRGQRPSRNRALQPGDEGYFDPSDYIPSQQV